MNKWSGKNTEQNNDFSNIQNEMESISLNKEAIISKLKELVKNKDYKSIATQSAITVRDIRETIDYDNDFKNFNLERFLSYWELGHIIPIYRNQTDTENIIKLREILNRESCR